MSGLFRHVTESPSSVAHTHTHIYIYRFPHVLDAYERRKPSHPLNTCWLTSSSENIHFLHRKNVHEFNEVSLFRTINIQVKVFQINTDKRSVLKSVLLRALTELRQYHWVPIYIKSSSAKFYYLLPRKRLQSEREREREQLRHPSSGNDEPKAVAGVAALIKTWCRKHLFCKSWEVN